MVTDTSMCGPSGHGHMAVGACELLDDRRAERRQVGRRAARRELTIHAHLEVDHLGAGVPEVRADARPRGHPAPRTTSASTSVHGPWQIAATGLPVATNAFTKPTASGVMRSLSGVTVPPGSSSAS